MNGAFLAGHLFKKYLGDFRAFILCWASVSSFTGMGEEPAAPWAALRQLVEVQELQELSVGVPRVKSPGHGRVRATRSDCSLCITGFWAHGVASSGAGSSPTPGVCFPSVPLVALAQVSALLSHCIPCWECLVFSLCPFDTCLLSLPSVCSLTVDLTAKLFTKFLRLFLGFQAIKRFWKLFSVFKASLKLEKEHLFQNSTLKWTELCTGALL